jgi:hypothetical protein
VIREGWADLRGRYRQGLTSGGSAALLAVALYLGRNPAGALCLIGVAAIALFAWASTLRRARAIADVATARIGSAAQGYVELLGRASTAPDELIHSPCSGMACIWWRWRIYSRNSDNDWRQIHSAVSSATFEIADGSGRCRVDPDHAEVIGADRRVSYRDGDKHVEELLFGGGMIYVLGAFGTVGGAHTAFSASADSSALLAEWKRDPVQLRRRFDLNGDGEIDLQEWELARRLAAKTVERQHREMRNDAELHIVRAPASGRMFLISTLAPQRLRRRYLAWSAFHLSVAITALALLGWTLG